MTRSNGKHDASARRWAYAVDGDVPVMLALALRALEREGGHWYELTPGRGESCSWARRIAECLRRGECVGAVVFCRDTEVCCCVANKVPGVRAAQVASYAQAERALCGLGANVLVVDSGSLTYFEYRQILRLCAAGESACPAEVACVLQELDGDAHR